MWFKWLLVTLLAWNGLYQVHRAGKPPKEDFTSNRQAVAIVVIEALLIIGVLHYFGRCS